MLLWEICALKKPYGQVKSAEEFAVKVFKKGSRPKLGKHWPQPVAELVTGCWSASPQDRPEMDLVKTTLTAHIRSLQESSVNENNLRKSSVFRRITG